MRRALGSCRSDLGAARDRRGARLDAPSAAVEPGGGATVVVVKGKNGHAVLLPSGVATHTTTHSSPVAGGR